MISFSQVESDAPMWCMKKKVGERLRWNDRFLIGGQILHFVHFTVFFFCSFHFYPTGDLYLCRLFQPAAPPSAAALLSYLPLPFCWYTLLPLYRIRHFSRSTSTRVTECGDPRLHCIRTRSNWLGQTDLLPSRAGFNSDPFPSIDRRDRPGRF